MATTPVPGTAGATRRAGNLPASIERLRTHATEFQAGGQRALAIRATGHGSRRPEPRPVGSADEPGVEGAPTVFLRTAVPGVN